MSKSTIPKRVGAPPQALPTNIIKRKVYVSDHGLRDPQPTLSMTKEDIFIHEAELIIKPLQVLPFTSEEIIKAIKSCASGTHLSTPQCINNIVKKLGFKL